MLWPTRLSHALRRRGAGGLALLILLASLQPLLAQLWHRAAGSPSDWVQVCGPSGMRWVALAASAGPAASPDDPAQLHADGSTGSEHCPWCRSGLHLPGLPPLAAEPTVAPHHAARPPRPQGPATHPPGLSPPYRLALVRAPPLPAA